LCNEQIVAEMNRVIVNFNFEIVEKSIQALVNQKELVVQ